MTVTPHTARQAERPGPARYRVTIHLVLITLVIVLLGAASGLGTALIWPKTYGARAEILYSLNQDQQGGDPLPQDPQLSTQVVILTSPAVLGPIAKQQGRPFEDLTKDISAKVLDNSEVIQVEVHGPSALAATGTAQAVIDSYLRLTAQPRPPAPQGQANAVQPGAGGADLSVQNGSAAQLLTPPYALPDPVSPRPLIAAGVGALAGVIAAGTIIALFTRRRTKPLQRWPIALLGLALLTAGCSATGPGSAGTGQESLPTRCTHTVTRGDDAQAALESASPGDTVCFSGSDLADTELTMTTSGTAQAPITLAADGATVREIQVKADHVILRGFTVTGGSGVLLEGTGLIARNNSVHDTQRGGITCDDCTDSTIEFNTMTRAASNGISISGQRITVHANTISQTVAVHNGDADGMRFFGNGHRITDNTISDISAQGYDNPPHPDCFQTLDDGKPPTFDVVISGNTCRNVDAQCLIATGDQGGNGGAPPGVTSIVFENNMCANNGAQAVNLRGWPDVQVLHNTFSGPNLTRAILIAEGSTGCTVNGNTTTGGRPTVEVDESSQQGSHVSGSRPS